MTNQRDWKNLGSFIEINSPWLRLIGEKLENDRGQVLDYWRIEKADSVVIVTIQDECFLLPMPVYRPGLKQETLDFPGGRVPAGKKPIEIVPDILTRELGVTEEAIIKLVPLNQTGWAINSSFSNQKLYGFVAYLSSEVTINFKDLGATYPTTPEGVHELLENLTCLQCRSLLLEWKINDKKL